MDILKYPYKCVKMNDEENILGQYMQIKNDLNIKSKRIIGTLFARLLKEKFEKYGFKVSEPNVLIVGVENELDLLIIRKESKSELDLIYQPSDVLAVFELKGFGIMSGDSINKIKNVFDKIININSKIFCCYLTLKEQKNYKYEVTKEKLGHSAYCLFKKDKGLFIPTGDWNKFLKEIENFK